MRNILFSSSFGDTRGGGQQSLLLLMKALDRSRFRPFLICPEHGDFVEEAKANGVVTAVMRIPPLKRCSLTTVWRLYKYLKDMNIDLVHADSPGWTMYLGVAIRLHKKPLIWHVRVGDPDPAWFETMLLAICSRMIAVSDAVGQRFARFQGAGKITVIHNAVDLSKFSPDLAGAEDVVARKTPCQLAIGTFGQLVSRKGQELLIEAAALAAARLHQKPLYFIVGQGEESYTTRLRLRARELGLGECVVFLGFRSDIARIMAALDVVILYSTFIEGFSRVIIEAMASGKPVIATELGGNVEAVIHGHNGLLVQPDNNPATLAQAIVDLAEGREERIRMGRNGRIRAEKLFDLRNCVARIETVYSDLLVDK